MTERLRSVLSIIPILYVLSLPSGAFAQDDGGFTADRPGGHRAEFLPRHAGAHMGLLFSNELAPWCSFGYEADLIWTDEGRPTAFFGLGLGFSLGERFSIQVEEFNYSHPDAMECWSELSLAYQLSGRVQLDIGTDISLNAPGKYQNLMLGVSWQLK